jgi:hypothetical protein
MSKRFLSILLLSALIMGIFSGCGHTHAFGDWEEVTPATYSKKGLQVRSCSCGEKEEAPIEKLKSETTKLKTSELGIVIGEVFRLEDGHAAIWIKKQGTSEYELLILEDLMFQVLQLANAA